MESSTISRRRLRGDVPSRGVAARGHARRALPPGRRAAARRRAGAGVRGALVPRGVAGASGKVAEQSRGDGGREGARHPRGEGAPRPCSAAVTRNCASGKLTVQPAPPLDAVPRRVRGQRPPRHRSELYEQCLTLLLDGATDRAPRREPAPRASGATRPRAARVGHARQQRRRGGDGGRRSACGARHERRAGPRAHRARASSTAPVTTAASSPATTSTATASCTSRSRSTSRPATRRSRAPVEEGAGRARGRRALAGGDPAGGGARGPLRALRARAGARGALATSLDLLRECLLDTDRAGERAFVEVLDRLRERCATRRRRSRRGRGGRWLGRRPSRRQPTSVTSAAAGADACCRGGRSMAKAPAEGVAARTATWLRAAAEGVRRRRGSRGRPSWSRSRGWCC